MKNLNRKEFNGKLVIDEQGNVFFETCKGNVITNATILGTFRNKFEPSTRMESRRRLEQEIQGTQVYS